MNSSVPETSKTTVFYSVKICAQEVYAREFIAGNLYMNSLDYFRTCTGDDGRPDPYEGIRAIYQPESIGTISLGPVTIQGKDLPPGRPLVVLHEPADKVAICSLFSANTVGFGNSITSEGLGELKKVMVIHDKCHRLGGHAVIITNMKEFSSRVLAAIDAKGFAGGVGLVHYYDGLTHSGKFKDVGLHKRVEYAYQREYRVIVYLPDELTAPYRLDVGDLSDIAVLTEPQVFNDGLRVALPDGTTA